MQSFRLNWRKTGWLILQSNRNRQNAFFTNLISSKRPITADTSSQSSLNPDKKIVYFNEALIIDNTSTNKEDVNSNRIAFGLAALAFLLSWIKVAYCESKETKFESENRKIIYFNTYF